MDEKPASSDDGGKKAKIEDSEAGADELPSYEEAIRCRCTYTLNTDVKYNPESQSFCATEKRFKTRLTRALGKVGEAMLGLAHSLWNSHSDHEVGMQVLMSEKMMRDERLAFQPLDCGAKLASMHCF